MLSNDHSHHHGQSNHDPLKQHTYMSLLMRYLYPGNSPPCSAAKVIRVHPWMDSAWESLELCLVAQWVGPSYLRVLRQGICWTRKGPHNPGAQSGRRKKKKHRADDDTVLIGSAMCGRLGKDLFRIISVVAT